MQTYIESRLEAARHTCDVMCRVMDDYWTPYDGHKISLRASIEKWRDLLFVAQSGQRVATNEREKMLFFRIECVVATQLKEWEAQRK